MNMYCLNKKNKGFTLVELMVTLTIMGLLMGYGLPSYNEFSQRQALAREANDLLGDLRFARNLAVDKNTTVRLDSINGVNWEGGWVIRQVLTNSPLTLLDVRVKDVISGDLTILAGNGINSIAYDAMGVVSQAATFTIANSVDNLTLTVSLSGLASTNRGL